MVNLNGKVVLITGCSSGIGLESALAFARVGAIVYATMRNPKGCPELSKRAKQENLPITILTLDVTKPSTIAMALKIIIKKEKRIDILVNNAGYGVVGPISDLSLDSLRAQYDTNLFGLVDCTQQCLSHMHSGAKIINVSSVVGHIGIPMMGAYCSSKFALEGISESLRRELFAHDIWVTLVEPGGTQTNFSTTSIQYGVAKRSLAYTKSLKLREKFSQQRNFSDSPAFVAKDIVRIAKKRRPALRYGVGIQGRVGRTILRIVPDCVIDLIFRFIA